VAKLHGFRAPKNSHVADVARLPFGQFCEFEAHLFRKRCALAALNKWQFQKKGFSMQSKKKARARHAIAWRA
jgi:hypothetical protein